MFKSIFSFIKTLFTGVEINTKNIARFSVEHTDVWATEAYAECEAKRESLGVNKDEMNDHFKSLGL